MDSATPRFSLRSLTLPFYLPAFLASLGSGLAIPLLPLYAETFGQSRALAGVIVGLFGLGSLCANVPAGILSARLGDRASSILSVLLQIVGALAAALARSAVVLGAGVFIMGAAQALFFVCRLSYFRSLVPTQYRGRALAVIGGEYRLGNAIGPVIGGFVAARIGYPATSAGFALLSVAVLLMLVRWAPRPGEGLSGAPLSPTAGRGGDRAAAVPSMRELLSGALDAFRGNGRIFATAGLAIVMLQFVRAGRSVVLPLWGNAIGLPVEQVGLAVGIMFGVEMLMFYPAGYIMDRFGRKWVGVPSLAILAAALFLLAFSHGFAGYLAVAALAGIGNGLGSGINMTLSTDYAPKENPASFIGAWRFIVDGGTTGGPFIVSAARAVAGLNWTGAVVAAFAFIGAAIMALFVQETKRSG